MTKRKKRAEKRVNPETEQQDIPAADPSQQEPAIGDWHALINATLEHDDEIQLTVQFLLLDSPSGQAFLEYIREYRPTIGHGPPFDFLELVTVYETVELLKVLIAEPRFGKDPDFFIWREFWDDSTHGPAEAYKHLIELSHVMEAKAKTDEDRLRMRFVREAIGRELQGEEYLERKKTFLAKLRDSMK